MKFREYVLNEEVEVLQEVAVDGIIKFGVDKIKELLAKTKMLTLTDQRGKDMKLTWTNADPAKLAQKIFNYCTSLKPHFEHTADSKSTVKDFQELGVTASFG